LLDLLNDSELRQIAVWKMEGYTSDEIAQKLQCVTRTVERKLRLIRKLWEAEFAS
jgi:DNA-directed RNA polymerase specialized sigma24 family protein